MHHSVFAGGGLLSLRAVVYEDVAAVGFHDEHLPAGDETDGRAKSALAVSHRAEDATKLCRQTAADSKQCSFSLMAWAIISCRLSPVTRPLWQEAGAFGAKFVPVDRLGPRKGIEVIVGLDRTDEVEAHAADGSERFASGAGHGACK